MKKIFFIFFLLPGLCSLAQKAEPYGDMTKYATLIFNEDVSVLEKSVIQNLKQLQGVELDKETGEPKLEKRLIKPNGDFSKGSWINKNLEQMDVVLMTVWWMPPKPPPQKVSEGGKNIKPVRSVICITIGCLKTNHQACAVQVEREWTYNARMHVPYTEIPLLRGESSEQGSYLSDHKWLHQLAPKKELSVEYTYGAYDSKILEILKTLPVKSE